MVISETSLSMYMKASLVVGYHLNCIDEPVFMTGPKPMRTEFGIHHRLESCVCV